MHNRDYQREYSKSRYYRLKQEALNYLGGKCATCGCTANLQFDHIDPSTKKYVVSTILKHPPAKLYAELDKCQLLCRLCHDQKSLKDLDRQPAKGFHGTLSSYRYCKCDLCRSAKAAYMRQYKKSKCEKGAKNPLSH